MNKNKGTKIIFIMGATGTGKSKLSVDIATRIPAEIINSDKIQFYAGLDIATNKLPVPSRRGVPHHLLATITDPAAEFTANQFTVKTLEIIAVITECGKIPVIVGGSNSYIEALVESPEFRSAGLDPLFLHLEVSGEALDRRIEDRVNEMVTEGLVDEIAEFFDHAADLSRGIWRSIGVLEMKPYLFPTGDKGGRDKRILANGIEEMKENTRILARKQTEKIRRLREENGWDIVPIDATKVFEYLAGEGDVAADNLEGVWEKVVLRPSLDIVAEFLNDDNVGIVENSFKSIHGGVIGREIMAPFRD